MNIYSIVDNTNIDKIITLFNSVYVNADNRKDSLKFFLITDEINISKIKIPIKLENKIFIRCLKFSENWRLLLDNFNKYFYKSSTWCKNNMNFGRFLFFEVFPEVDRVIYLDWDMIVYSNIFELEKYFLKTSRMIVADCNVNMLNSNTFITKFQVDNNINIMYGDNKTLKILKFLKIDYNILKKINGFNSGFFIVSKIHFDKYYLQNLINKLILVQKKYKCFNFGTQVIMNFMHLKDRLFIEKYWNYMPQKVNDLKKIKIIHWNGKNKPWNSDVYLKNIWYNYNKINSCNFNEIKNIDISGNINFVYNDVSENLIDVSENLIDVDI